MNFGKTLFAQLMEFVRCAVKNGVHVFKQRLDLHSIAA